MPQATGSEHIVYAGIDEAGYGPRLGPLCVAMSAFEVEARDDAPAPDLWKRLSRMVSREPAKAKRGRIAINDSKKLKLPSSSKSAHPLVHLECGVLTILRSLGHGVASDEDLWRALGVRFGAAPWYGGARIDAPVSTSEERLATLTNSFRSACAKGGVRALDVQCRALAEAEFNAALSSRGVKSAVSFELVGELLRRVWDRWGRRRTTVVIDRQGGRVRYGAALEAALPGAGVEVVSEAREASRYRVESRDGERGLEVVFAVEADGAHLPTAVASMTAKLVRESAMARFNRHWCALRPELKPTAGYGTDAARWIGEVGPRLSASERGRLVRRT